MDAKELLEYLGIEADNIDTFKEKFQGGFIPKDQAPDEDRIKSQTVGKFTGAFKTLAKKHFELNTEDLAKVDRWEDMFDLGIAKINKKIEDARGLGVQTNDAQLKELNTRLEQASQLAKEYKEANELLQNSVVEKETEWSGKLKGVRGEFEKKNALFLIKDKLSDTLTKGDKFLLEQEINGLQIDFAENDQVIVKDKEGKQIPSPKKVGQYLSLPEAIEYIAEKEGFIKKNNATPPVRTAAASINSHAPAAEGQRQLHPNAIKAAEVGKS